MLPIYVMWDKGVNYFESQAILNGLLVIREIFPDREITPYGEGELSKGDCSSADSYVTKVRGDSFSAQLDAKKMISIIANDYRQKLKPHIAVMVTSRDLVVPGSDFCLSMTQDRVIVQSVAKFRSLTGGDKSAAISALVQHELGHIFGAAGDLSRPNTTGRFGPHCANSGCIMRHSRNVRELANRAFECQSMGRVYCPECLAEIRKTQI